MNILIAAIGSWGRAPEKSLYDHYLARLPWKVELRELNSKKNDKQDEAAMLLDAAKSFGAHHTIALDERGKSLGSEALAKQLGSWLDMGDNKLAILIGGHHGLDESVRQAADLVISFGELTWPHMLVRPMLAEQLYRCQTILTGHPYHRS